MNIQIGNRVALSRTFLQSTSQYTGWAPFARGVVVQLDELSSGCTLASVEWDDKQYSQVNIHNLVREDRIPFEN